MLAGKAADAFGRKKTLIGSAVLFAVSAVGAGWSHTFVEFSFYRILGGLAIGSASGVVPIYIAETAPTCLRGRFVSFYQIGHRDRHLRRLLLQLLPPCNRRQRLALDAHGRRRARCRCSWGSSSSFPRRRAWLAKKGDDDAAHGRAYTR